MSRLMSVAMTTDAVLERRKTVTRRKGWSFIHPGDRLTLCAKVQGRRPGEPLVRLAEVEVIAVRREVLDLLCHGDGYGRTEVEREGFPGMDPHEFVGRYFVEAQGIYHQDKVTRIEWRYLDHAAPTRGRVWTDDVNLPTGGKRLTLKRCCNDCGRQLGDVHDHELDAAMAGRILPDVHDECGCRS